MHGAEAREDGRAARQRCLIKVAGLGGGGCNAVNSMIRMGIQDVEFYTINTDAQHLESGECPNKILIGQELTGGLGCGGDVELGRRAAEAARDEIIEALCDAGMVFIMAGLGGGAGTGGAPVAAALARELGILTVAIVTRPFRFEGPLRRRRAEEGLARLRESCDSLIVVSNDRLLEVAGPQASLLESFELANRVLGQGVWSIAEMISRPALIRVDFADVRAMMSSTGGAVLGIGEGTGDSRAADAVRQACTSPLLDKAEVTGARRILMSFAGPSNLTLHEVYEAANQVRQLTDENVDMVFGVRLDDTLDDTVKVTILATGFDERQSAAGAPDRVSETEPVEAPEADGDSPVRSSRDARSAHEAVQQQAAPAASPAPVTTRAKARGTGTARADQPVEDKQAETSVQGEAKPSGATGAAVKQADPIGSSRSGDDGVLAGIEAAATGPSSGRMNKSAGEPDSATAAVAPASFSGMVSEKEEDFHLTDDLREVLARWDQDGEAEDVTRMYTPFPGRSNKESATEPISHGHQAPVSVAHAASGGAACAAETPATPAAVPVKPGNGRPVREKAAGKPEPAVDIFDAIDEARGQGRQDGNSLHDRKPRRDATRPEPKPDEEDLEIPAFLRRRRSGFRIF
ncbi:MAG: hypothetical protein Kow0059_14330 [Candidatus Sumerlaeia bacterium]